MKVSDVMSKQVDYVTTDTKVKDVCRFIFGRGINGVPVCKGRKVIGFITERDILAKFFPSMQEYMEDPVHSADFEEMEKKTSEVLSLTAEEIMSKSITTVILNTPLLRAQSLMFTNKVGRLPVVDKNGNLIGIVTNGDIFRSVIGGKLPLEEEAGFFDWMSRYYDVFIDWDRRLRAEIPDLVKLFKKEKVKRILDMASSSGEHALALAKSGFDVVGLETSRLIYNIGEKKREKLAHDMRKRVRFLQGSYQEKVKEVDSNVNAAIFLGNALPHVIQTDPKILDEVSKVLNHKGSVMVFQVLNLEKTLKKSGFRDFIIRKSPDAYNEEIGFLLFYKKGKGRQVVFHFAIFDIGGDKLSFRGVHTTHLFYTDKKEIAKMLARIGFKNITFYGGSFYGPLFSQPFSPDQSDWLNVVAKR